MAIAVATAAVMVQGQNKSFALLGNLLIIIGVIKVKLVQIAILTITQLGNGPV